MRVFGSIGTRLTTRRKLDASVMIMVGDSEPKLVYSFFGEKNLTATADIAGGFECEEQPQTKAVEESLQKLAHKAFDSAELSKSAGREGAMTHDFKVGDHVEWNSEAGRVRGTITKKHTSEITFKGYSVHASKEEPQYEIKSDKTDHVAMHKGAALTAIAGSKS